MEQEMKVMEEMEMDGGKCKNVEKCKKKKGNVAKYGQVRKSLFFLLWTINLIINKNWNFSKIVLLLFT